MLPSANNTTNNIRSANTLQTLKQPNYKTHTSTTTAATELANMIKSSFMLGSAFKNQDIHSTRNQKMQPPHFLTSINSQNQKSTGSVLIANSDKSAAVKNVDFLAPSATSTLRVPNADNNSKTLLPPTTGGFFSKISSRISFGAK
jgi:ornithine carbamoyltransferase